ncbi:hypothetical protein [Turicibacter sanguinis]|uniref:hypothetical protein n=1 Tax=Turicibacter sanguinis TaxID=154288 RepID=UPI0032EB1FF0
MIETMVVLRQWSVDVIALLVFLIAAYLGYKDTFRFSFLQLILQLISMIATYFISIFLTNKAIQTIPENANIGLMIPDELFYLVQPHEEMIIPLIMFVIIYIFIFIIIKSILYVFGRNYEWERYLFRKIKLNSTFGRILSSGCTILNTYTYLIIVLMIVGFPLFNLVGPHTFSSFLLKTVPFISKDIEEFYAPYETLTQVLQTYKEEAHLIFDGTTVNLKVMEEMIQKDPSRKNSLQDAYEYLIPYIATTSGYLANFSNNKIGINEMKEYLANTQEYLNNQTITLEIFNSYYEELIKNKTYDRLVKDEVINDDALTALVESGFLNDTNLKKIKEYIALD